jgi:hypothetical protein
VPCIPERSISGRRGARFASGRRRGGSYIVSAFTVAAYDGVVARILIVGGGCRGRRLAREMVGAGHVLRVTTRTEDRREAIEATGAECWVGTPDRLATLRPALENVTIACWLLGCATGEREQVRALSGARLEAFVRQLIDTTVRGFICEAAGTASSSDLAAGARSVAALGERNAIPVATLTTDPRNLDLWLADACAAVGSLLESSGRERHQAPRRAAR